MPRSIQQLASYDAIYRSFQWNVPIHYNMAYDVCDRHADEYPDKVALTGDDLRGGTWSMTFRQVQRRANRMANWLIALGLQRGDRVMLLLPQDPWTAIAHVACWKAGLVSLPTSVLFGTDAISYRLSHAQVRVVITDRANFEKAQEARQAAPITERVFLIDGDCAGGPLVENEIARAAETYVNVDTLAEEPAFLNFTSGTTGNPKGVLQAHRAILGYLPGIEFACEFLPQSNDVLWTPADWSWVAGLMGILMPAWYHGLPVVAFRGSRFNAEEACSLMVRHGVTVASIPPTALRMMRQLDDVERFELKLRVVLSGGESVGSELQEWATEVLKAPVNEAFGQTECNMVIGNCASVLPVKSGSLGRELPGHVCAIVNDLGERVSPGTIGHIAVQAPDPVMMLGYWRDPIATDAKYIGQWLITGDLGHCDADGYFWYISRSDDVITTSGYRVGPLEIEEALARHPAVLLSAAIGVPDTLRTESIKAFVVLRKGFEASPELATTIQTFVRERLAKHEMPREIAFVDALPLTVTGKVLRRELRNAEIKRLATS